MTTDTTRAHVDAETMAAWADRALPAEEAAAVELHLSNCDRCQEVLAAFVRSEPVRSEPTTGAVVIPFWARRPVQWSAAGLAAAAALVAMIWIGRPPAPPVPESTVASAPIQSSPVPPSQPPQSSSATALPEQRRDKPAARRAVDDKKTANQAVPKKTEGRVAAAPPPPAVAAPAAAVPQAVALAPPPVTVSAVPPAVTPVGAVRPSAMYESAVMDAVSVVAPAFEIAAPDPNPAALRSLGGGAGRGGAAAAKALSQSPGSTRWRVIAGTRVERTVDAGATWSALPIEPVLKTALLAGSATSPLNCWLVGREGVVLVTNDGSTFRRVPVPEAVHLTGITAQDGMRAMVTAIDGRTFSTIDGGLTWK